MATTYSAWLFARHVVVALERLAQDRVVRFLGDAAATAGVEGGEIPAHAVNHPLAWRPLLADAETIQG